MPISVVCQCGAKLNAKEELAGKAVKCPKCSQPIKIPAAGTAAPTQPATAKPTAPNSPAKPTAPAKPSASDAPKPSKAPAKAPAAPKPAADDPMGGLFDDIGLAPAPAKHDIVCPKCGAGMKEGAILCIACGFNTKTGKQLASSSDSAAIAKREEYFAQQAAKAEAQQAKILAAGGGKATASGKPRVDKPDVELSAIDYIFCIFCGGIALIVSIIYCVTGNPKGPAMLKLVLIVQAVLFVIGFVGGIVSTMMIPQQ